MGCFVLLLLLLASCSSLLGFQPFPTTRNRSAAVRNNVVASSSIVKQQSAIIITASRRRILVVGHQRQHSTALCGASSPPQTTDDGTTARLQAFSSGYSVKTNLLEALQEAVANAIAALPEHTDSVDLCTVSISSLYDGAGGDYQPATIAVPAILAAMESNNVALHHLIGSSCAGCIGGPQGRPVELESIPAVSVTLAVLPDTQLKTFHVAAADLPEGRVGIKEWKRAVGLSGVGETGSDDDGEKEETVTDLVANAPTFWLLPSPAFSTELDDLLQGLASNFPGCTAVGGIASTVSSLSRAKLYRWSAGVQDVCFADGCVGVCISGDFQIQSLTAQGAKPVGGIYQILKGQGSSIQVVVLDETATEALKAEEEEEEEDDDDEEDETPVDAKAAMAQIYAKAQIPKPPLAEANFLMRTLSDDDQAFMKRQLLVGLEQGGSVGRTASELARLAAGEGHRFTVYQVASAGMKDGSVTLPLGCVNITPGTRLRYFVREPDFARREVEALWTGYKKRLLNNQFGVGDEKAKKSTFSPGCCFLIPTLDRGSKFFSGKPGYESATAARMLPGVPCISGFFANGIIGRMDGSEDAKIGIQGSASGYFLLGSKSGRPVYSAAAAAAEKAARDEKEAKEAEARVREADDDKRREARAKSVADLHERAPRSEDGELILKRREVHSGRALTVSTVEWSVAEKTAKPSSALEGFMWDKETEVDRFRERVPLANLVSQCRQSVTDPNAPKPRDWVGPVKRAAAEKGFAIIPECKRADPSSGSLRRRYDLGKLAKEFTIAGAPAISVNCDAILFGGSIEHITEARTASSQAAVETMSEDGVVVPPILASDLILYPYQLYKLRLAGADAVNLVGGALATKDRNYLAKIASSVQLQTLVTVTSKVQIDQLLELDSLDGVIVSNRELEDFSFDETGEQALSLLKSDAMKALREKHGDDILVLAEGRIGIIERPDADGNRSAKQYLQELKDAGAAGAIVGGGLAAAGSDSIQTLEELQSAFS